MLYSVCDSVMHLCPFCNRRTINLIDDDDDENWPQHRALRNAANQGNGRRPYASATDKFPSARHLRPEPVPCDVGDPKARFETLRRMSWSTVSNAADRSRRTRAATSPRSDGKEDVGQDAQDGRLGGVTRPEAGL